eukprot:scpid2291/ scgid18403/ Thrombospondin-3
MRTLALAIWLILGCNFVRHVVLAQLPTLGKQPIEQCPSPLCDCRNLGDGEVDIFCQYLNMTGWPKTFLPRTRSLHFDGNHLASLKIAGSERYPSIQNVHVSYNRIVALADTDLLALANLRYLDIRFNGLTTIDDTTFRYTPLLTTLLLSNNAILRVTRATFFGLSQLTNLDLSQQSVPLDVEQHSFAGPIRLRNLSLADCGLTEIPTTDFRTNLPQLRVLELSNNSISIIPDNVFFSLNNLETLDFSRNLLVNFTQASLYGLENLRTMNLAYNPLEEIVFDNYRYVPRLRNLDLRFSKIEEIVPYGFVPSSPLGIYLTLDSFLLRGNLLTVVRYNAFYRISTNLLDLSYNLIERVESNTFGTIPHLDFSHNRLTEVSSAAFSDNDVRTVNVSHNFLSRIPYEAFRGINIHYIDLSFNNISLVDRGAFRAPGYRRKELLDYVGNLQTLNISYQDGNWQLENGTFRLLENLEVLDLRSAGISNYSGDAFTGLEELQELDIRDNRAVNLPDLTGIHGLLTLRMNLLGNLHSLPMDYFWPTPNITNLYMANGRLQSMEVNIFRNFTRLTTLDLSSNLLISFDVDLFGGANISLAYLNLNSNPSLKSIPSSVLQLYPSIATLLLKACSIPEIMPTAAFMPAASLHTLDLSYNLITSLDASAFLGAGELTNLYLNHNQLHSIHAQAFTGLPRLKTLHLHGNRLVTLPQGLFPGVIDLSELRLDGNRLSTLPEEYNNISASALHLYNNPWECTCSIFWLHNRLNSAVLPFEDMIRCALPTNYTNIQVGQAAEAFVFCVPPSIVAITPSQQVLQGAQFHVNCQVFGYPAPEVRWYKDASRLLLTVFNASDLSTHQRLTQGVNGSLLFSNVLGSDESLYTCIATSPVRTTSANVYLTVIDDCRNGSCFLADVTLRYFNSPHPDFSKQPFSSLLEVVSNQLLPSSGSPTLNNSRVPSVVGPARDITSEETFLQWFKTERGVNEEGSVQLRFNQKLAGSESTYTFTDESFYPADRYNGTGSLCSGFFRTSQFTGVLRTVFPLSQLRRMTIRTSHTAWMYLDQQLVVDLGGVHATVESTVDFSNAISHGIVRIQNTGDAASVEVAFTLKHNTSLRFELFFANRIDCNSSLSISVTYQAADGSSATTPVFVSTTQTGRFLERSPVNTTLLDVRVPSLDYVLHSAKDIAFSLATVDSSVSKIHQFAVNATSGTVTLVSSLDYEVAESYILKVLLTGTSSTGDTVTVTVAAVISVRNELDAALYFDSPSYSVSGIDGGRHRRDGTELLQLILIDNDEGRSSVVVMYEVKPPTASDYRHQGKVTTVTVLVQAIDNGKPARRAEANVTVQGIGVCEDGIFSIQRSPSSQHVITLSVLFSHYFITEVGSCETCTAGFFCPGDGLRYLCGCQSTSISVGPVLRFRSAAETSGCVPMTTHSFGKSSACSACPSGWICKGGIASPCGLQSVGLQAQVTYADACTTTHCQPTCLQCPEGHACFNGIRRACGPGTFSNKYVSCDACPVNSYSRNSSNAVCHCCDAGFESTSGKNGCRQCDPSEYSNGTLAGGSCDVCHTCLADDLCPCKTLNPCSAGVVCVNTPRVAPFYKCLQCPEGLTGDGINCADIDECTAASPCSSLSQCVNTNTGYYCTACPEGYRGITSHGVGITYAMNNKQTCSDFNECLVNNGGCDPLSYCNNTQGGFLCGPCIPGFLGNGYSGCTSGDYCSLGVHDCHSNATCTMTGVAQYTCECKMGFAGTGRLCADDSDLDGYPSERLDCEERSCLKDNCPTVPNSDQSDTDGDHQGDGCDHDDDGDSWIDSLDNCQYVPNIDQRDRDGDNIGDACDNCPETPNPLQWDSDQNSIGDACSTDSDGDGLLDANDGCPRVAGTSNDTANPGPECRSCPPFQGVTVFTPHTQLLDSNFDDIANNCNVSHRDSDLDGIPDGFDNCPSVANADQADHDGGGAGDLCEGDDDEDGIADTIDNCHYVPNPRQVDSVGNGIGDACRNDYDGDGVNNAQDACPFMRTVQSGNMSVLLNISIPVESMADVKWHVTPQGSTVTLTSQSSAPIILLAPPRLGSVDFSGTVHVQNSEENDFFGFVFSFQSTSRFYLLQWKRTAESFLDLPSAISKPYWQLLKSPSTELETWLGNSSIYEDKTGYGWLPHVTYSWVIQHRPDRGHIRIVVRNASHLILDSGSISDGDYRGGRLGLFSFWQADTTWSNLSVSCAEKFNYALHFDGVDDFVHLPSATALALSQSFTIELWLRPVGRKYDAPLPIVSSPDGSLTITMSLAGVITATLGNATIQSTAAVPFGQWSHCALANSINGGALSLTINFASTVTVTAATAFKGSDRLYLGRDVAANVFHGEMEEVRFWGDAKSSADLQPYRLKGSLEGLSGLSTLRAQYTFDGETGPIVKDSSDNTLHALAYGSTSRYASYLDVTAALPTADRDARKRRNVQIDPSTATDSARPDSDLHDEFEQLEEELETHIEL